MLNYLLRYKFSILLAGFILFVSLLPDSSLPESPWYSIPFIDKMVHFAMYGTLGFVLLLETRCKAGCLKLQLFLLLSVFVMSALIELLQATVVVTRSAEWLDLFANFMGLVAGTLFYKLLLIFRS